MGVGKIRSRKINRKIKGTIYLKKRVEGCASTMTEKIRRGLVDLTQDLAAYKKGGQNFRFRASGTA